MGIKKRILAVLLCLAFVFAMAGCGSQQAADTSSGQVFAKVQDDLGREVTLEKKPERIVVTSASFLEPLHEVGGDVVGRPDSKTKMPDYAKDKASIGKVYQIDVEKVLACEPDLVIINKGMNEKLVDTLEASGVKTLVVEMKSYADVKREVALFAQVTGEKAKGEALISNMDEKIKAVKEKLPQEKRRVAVIHSTNQGLTVQLSGSIAGSVAEMLGWENVAGDMTPLEKDPDSAPYSLETMVEKNPELLFVTSMGKLEEIQTSMDATMAQSPAWQSVEAVRQKKVFYLPQDLFLLSPGIHYPEAVEMMAKLVHPDKFQ